MASGLIVLLLGCWLPGRSGVSGQWLYPKPSISISPSGVIPVGGNVTIRCWHHEIGDLWFFFYKDGAGIPPRNTDSAGSEAEFPILSVRREQRGNYTCRYSDRPGDGAYSEHSDPVEIIVVDYTWGNVARLALGTGVLLLLALILAEAARGWKRGRF